MIVARRDGTSCEVDAIVFDFDGVLTDNGVYVDADGRETVRCNRADGLGFDILRAEPVRVFILSTERNEVVARRAEKLGVPAIHAVADKVVGLAEIAAREGFTLERTLYVGNDLNDLAALRRCGASACPADSHPSVLAVSTWPLRTAGGAGVVREIVEEILSLGYPPRQHQ